MPPLYGLRFIANKVYVMLCYVDLRELIRYETLSIHCFLSLFETLQYKIISISFVLSNVLSNKIQ